MTYVVDCSDMSTTFRRGNDRTPKPLLLLLLYRYQFAVVAVSLSLFLLLIIFLPKPWFSSSPYEERASKHKNVKDHKLEAMTDFHFKTLETKWIAHGRKTKRIHVADKTKENVPLTYGQVLNLLQSNPEFREDFFDTLQRGLQTFSDGDTSSYFFETPPVTFKTKDKTTFEFVLVSAKELNDVTADPNAFEKYFEDCVNRVAAFPSLGKDATLIVPCRPEQYQSLDTFAHLANFMRTGSDRHMHDFWIEAGRQMEAKLKQNPTEKIWMSTSGTGIYWLHLRLDTRPKYYTFTSYREA